MNLVTSLLALPLLFSFAQDIDPAKGIKSKDVTERLAAIETLAQGGHEKASKLLAGAVDDKDWEVAERAALALAKVGDEKALDDLVAVALNGPCARVRAAAAAAIAAVAPEEGAKALAKKITGKTAARACDALALVAPQTKGLATPRAVAKLVRDEKAVAAARAAAARALVASAGDERIERLSTLFDSDSVVVVAAALEAAAVGPVAEQVDLLAGLMARDSLVGVLERRAGWALAASLEVMEHGRPERAAALLSTLGADSRAAIAARAPRLLPLLVPIEGLEPAALADALDVAFEHADAGVRAQAAGALRALGDAGLERAHKVAAEDLAPRARQAGVMTIAALAPLAEESGKFFAERLAVEEDAGVREQLCVALGHPEHAVHSRALAAALDDEAWEVSACAAVSLGLTRAADGLEPLKALAGNDEWRRRGAALVGLYHLRDKDGVPLLIEALADSSPSIVRTCHAALQSYAGNEPLPAEVQPWRDWYQKNRERVRLVDPKEVNERRKRYGYAVPAREIYRGLDVCVLESRGDHIQVLLDELDIEHRLTAGARVSQDALDVSGVFVSNCTGEIENSDVEVLAWFVRCGGYLFGSCWALSQTIERVAPGPVRKLSTSGEVLDTVFASPCAPNSKYVKGLFAEGVQPIYTLEGAHLIEVLLPERVEVLIDSAECAERWGGGGELACWFTAGHGVILDSVNHFDLQGFERAVGLKKPEDRQAYAVDHLGLDYETLRETKKEKWWKNSHKAAQHVRDFSVFELVTNFVRLRRMDGK